MEHILTFILLITVVVLLILLLLEKLQKKEIHSKYSHLERKTTMYSNIDNQHSLYVMSREIANELMERDAGEYLERFQKLCRKWKEMDNNYPSTKEAHLDIIVKKYPDFKSFDKLETMPHILYADALSIYTYDELWELYESMRLYEAILSELEIDWGGNSNGIEQKELNDLKEYCKQISDTKLLAHLHKASEQLSLLENIEKYDDNEGEWKYETKDYKFKVLYHVAELRWGIYVKCMNRYGIRGIFYGDENETYESYYMANEKFEEKEYLNTLNIRMAIDVPEI